MRRCLVNTLPSGRISAACRPEALPCLGSLSPSLLTGSSRVEFPCFQTLLRGC